MNGRLPMRCIGLVCLGAILNVEVAWACAQWSRIAGDQLREVSRITQGKQYAAWCERARDAGLGSFQAGTDQAPGLRVYVGHGFGLSTTDVYPNGRFGRYGMSVVTAGIPCRSVTTHVVRDQHEPEWTVVGGVVGLREELRPLPCTPVWSGFAINTALYAAILWMLFAAPFALLRWRRIKRGLCLKCAYPVGTSDRCTECGAANVLKRNEEPQA